MDPRPLVPNIEIPEPALSAVENPANHPPNREINPSPWWCTTPLFITASALMVFLYFWYYYLFILYAAVSIATIITYGNDKSAAQRGAWRTAESVLHTLSVTGGWPGALIGQNVFRHKTKKVSFQKVFKATVALNIVLLVAVVLSSDQCIFIPADDPARRNCTNPFVPRNDNETINSEDI